MFNQNDSKPIDFDAITAFGPFDAHFVQFSGAIWYPMVYRLPLEEKQAMGRRKRANQLARAARMVKEIDATRFFPFAGPPCFLDESLFHLNDLGTDDSNIFLDQHVALEHMRSEGVDNGVLTIPGTVVEVRRGPAHGDPSGARRRGHAAVPRQGALPPRVPGPRAARRSKPRRRRGPTTRSTSSASSPTGGNRCSRSRTSSCAGVNGRVLLQTEDEAVVVDFLDRRVGRWDGEICRFRFDVPRALVESCIHAPRRGLGELAVPVVPVRSRARRAVQRVRLQLLPLALARAHGVHGARTTRRRSAPMELWEAGGYAIQRRCPHLKADLTRFGSVEDGILTCAMHGWRFELATGRCLTSDDRRLFCEPLDDP